MPEDVNDDDMERLSQDRMIDSQPEPDEPEPRICVKGSN